MSEDVPEVPVRSYDEELQRTPEMPSLQSILGRTLQSVRLDWCILRLCVGVRNYNAASYGRPENVGMAKTQTWLLDDMILF